MFRRGYTPRKDGMLRRGRVPLAAKGMLTGGMLAFLVALVALLPVGCGSADAVTTEGGRSASAVSEAGFSGVALDGTEVSLSQYRGKPLVLVFMATW